ncbi:BnaA06g36190D [Brassica napus]|uniref:BnaA06g36190D protein n=1 Tax=Brassica napus TaxID=3708 RepID=A0A078H7I5_BRANA|nr:BnaA06g36190D [Brassica napus]
MGAEKQYISRRSWVSVAIKSRRATRVSLMFQISTRGSIPCLLVSRIGQAARFPLCGP